MAPLFVLSSGIGDASQTRMVKRPLDHIVTPPNTKIMDHMQHQLSKMMAGFFTTEKEQWVGGKYGCLLHSLEDADLDIVTWGVHTANTSRPKPDSIHTNVTDGTKLKKLLRLAKVQDEATAAYHIQEAAAEVGVALMVSCIDKQYLVKIDKLYVR